MWIRRKQKAGRARKLSAEILEYLVFSVVVAAFTFLFLYAMGQSVSTSTWRGMRSGWTA